MVSADRPPEPPAHGHVLLAPGDLTADAALQIDGVETASDSADGTELTTRRPADVLTALASRQLLHRLQLRAASLEDVFLDLTGREYRA